MPLDTSDRKLLNLIQTDFPLVREPFADLARQLGTNAEDVIQCITRLKETGIIRLIGPVMDSRSLGYQTTLAAMKVSEANQEKTEKIIAGHSGVSHGYERDHWFNVWFTLAVPSSGDIEAELAGLAQAVGAETVISLPTVKMFKIGAYFDMAKNETTFPAVQRRNITAGQIAFSRADRLIINEVQGDLPLTVAPFSGMAERAGIGLDQFLSGCRSLHVKGVIRRFSASINHAKVGFTANAMACWKVPADKIDIAGREMALWREVSHCYERKTNREWPYNLFVMIHGQSQDLCREIAGEMSDSTDLADYALLFSTKEFKKTRIKYLI